MGTVSDRRWPVAPLMKELGVTTPGELAVACGVDEWAAERAMSYGLTLTDLDAWCAAAEITPGEVWPEFAPPAATASKSKPGTRTPSRPAATAQPAAREQRVPAEVAPRLPDGMVFEDPPARFVPKGRPAVWPDVVEPLKEHPGRWVRVREFDKVQQAASAAGRIRRLGGYETRAARNADGRGVLYVRFMGEDAVVPLRRRVG